MTNSIEAIDKLAEAQALLSVLSEITNTDPFIDLKMLGFGIYLNITKVEKLVKAAKQSLEVEKWNTK